MALIVVACVVAIGLIAALALAVGGFRPNDVVPAASPTPPPSPTSVAPSPTPEPTTEPEEEPEPTTEPEEELVWHSVTDRPGYDEMVDYVEGTLDRYRAAMSDGSIFDDVPATEEGLNYAQSFLWILTDQKSALRWGPEESLIPGELDAYIAERRNATEQLEEKFLAGEDLGYTVQITKEDGSVFEGTGTLSGEESIDAEAFARDFTGSPDADGRYVGAGEELAEAFGLQVSYDFSGLYDGCTPGPDDDSFSAAYCSATPTLIFVNNDHPEYEALLQRPSYVELIKHEIAHHQINMVCNTIWPPIAGDESMEAVTNSYAALYLEADISTLQGTDAYVVNDATEEIARLIGEEQRCE